MLVRPVLDASSVVEVSFYREVFFGFNRKFWEWVIMLILPVLPWQRLKSLVVRRLTALVFFIFFHFMFLNIIIFYFPFPSF
jgi:hypothetical protein